MEIEEKIKPNSEECLRRDEFSYWSYLPSDILISVLERLGFADFQGAKSVCSSWYSASKQSLPNSQIPWLILFPEEDSNNNSCSLFNPDEESKLYQTQDLGVEFTKSVCLATCGCWLFMRDPRYNLFILNLLTNERINLPPVESLRGRIKIERTLDDGFLVTNFLESKNLSIRSPVLWIDDNTKDYAVLWGVGTQSVVHSKKGDHFWSQIEKIISCIHMVYKDHKLYMISSRSNDFRIFNFSREVPQEIAQCTMNMYKVNGKYYPACMQYYTILETTLVVTLTGDVLRVNRVLRKSRCRCRTWLFHVYKVYSSGVLMEIHEQVHSLGDEAIVLDLGITVLANDSRGFRRNCIYFPPAYRSKYPYEVFIYNMETKKKEKLHTFDCSTARLFSARWFLPRVTQI